MSDKAIDFAAFTDRDLVHEERRLYDQREAAIQMLCAIQREQRRRFDAARAHPATVKASA